MPTAIPRRAVHLLRDERGTLVLDWGFPLLLLVMLGIVLAPYLAGQHEPAPLHPPAATQVPGQHMLS